MIDRRPSEVSIPEGLGPGDVPDDTQWPKSLWVILPAEPTESQSESFRRLRTKIGDQEGLKVSEVRVQNRKGQGGLEFSLIPAEDVAALYRRAHRARTAVIAFCASSVLLDISELPSNKGCMALQRFIQYKCSFNLVSRPEEVEGALVSALAWMGGIHCEGGNDPRCYPTAVFETNQIYPLETPKERQEFIRVHRVSKRSNSLTDARGRAWQVGPYHTLELIQVGGRTLPIGFHWDVQAARDSIIATGWETWRLPGRGYTNISPDAMIRGGNATKTHPSAAEKRVPKPPKTPRSTRQRKRR
jgi:hypothetical protein